MTMVVAYDWKWLVVPKTIPCVRTVATWTSPYVRESVLTSSHLSRIHIGGLVPMAPKSVLSTGLDATVMLIVTMAQKPSIRVTNMIALWSFGSGCLKQS